MSGSGNSLETDSKHGRVIEAKSALSKTGIPGFDYCLNPYIGCLHACKYCYASFMIRFTGHMEEWGEFLDVRGNLPELLEREIRRKKKGIVMVSTVTDPYQSAEEKHGVTRRCLMALAKAEWPVSILTKSPLVLRDIDVLHSFKDVEVGVTITTDSESIRRMIEPNAPPLAERRRALRELREAGIPTYAFVGPVLRIEDGPSFAAELGHITDKVLLDRMNYIGKVRSLYRRKNLSETLEPEYFDMIEKIFIRELGKKVEVI